MNRLLATMFACAAALLVGCGSTASSFDIPFERRSRGIGPLPTLITLPAGQESAIVGAALLDVLQELDFGIEKPELVAGTPLPEKQWIETDIVPLTKQQVESLSTASPGRPLPNDREMGAGYRLQYAVKDRRIHVLSSLKLYQRSALGGEWLEYNGTYLNTPLLRDLRMRMELKLKERVMP